jgi:predicted ester cyclase
MPDARDVILKHIAAVNDRDGDADPWAADAELVAPGGQASGRDGVIGFLGVFQEAFPDLRLEIKQLLTDGPAAAAEGTIANARFWPAAVVAVPAFDEQTARWAIP